MKAPASIAERPANEECDNNGNISEKMLPLTANNLNKLKQDMSAISNLTDSHSSPNSIVGNSMRENFYHAPV